MNTQYYQIQPKLKIVEKTIKSFSIKITDFIFNQGVTLLVTFYDSNGILDENHFIELKGEDYNRWSNDDNYIIYYICDKFNLILQK